jgi:hypothetical protein
MEMNENFIAENIGKSIYTLIILLIGFCAGYFFFIFQTGKADGEYREIINEAAKQYRELEDRNKQLEADLARVSATIDDGAANMERAVIIISDDNTTALDAVRELREIQKQIQECVLNSGSDSGGVGGSNGD